jgi:DNA-binding MarR family transcriptional regulator
MPKKSSSSFKTKSSQANVRQLADRLHSAAIHLLRRLRRVDDSTGLTAPKLSALSVIVFGGPITLGDLAKTEQVRPPTMTHLVRELQRADLVRTRTDTEDRRVTRVEATARGSQLLTKGRSRRIGLLAQWLCRLEKSEIDALKNAIDALEGLARPHDLSNR